MKISVILAAEIQRFLVTLRRFCTGARGEGAFGVGRHVPRTAITMSM